MKEVLGPFLCFSSNAPSYWLMLVIENEVVTHRYTVDFEAKPRNFIWALRPNHPHQNFYIFNGPSPDPENSFVLVVHQHKLYKIVRNPLTQRVNLVERYTFDGKKMTWHGSPFHLAVSSNNALKECSQEITPFKVNLEEIPFIYKNKMRFINRIIAMRAAIKLPPHLISTQAIPDPTTSEPELYTLSDAIDALCEPLCIISSTEPTIEKTDVFTLHFWNDKRTWMLRISFHDRVETKQLGEMQSDKRLIDFLQSVEAPDDEPDITQRLKIQNLMGYICARSLGLSLNQRKIIESVMNLADIWPFTPQLADDLKISYLTAIFSQNKTDLVHETRELYDAYTVFMRPENLCRIEQSSRFYTASASSEFVEIEHQARLLVVYDFIQLVFMTGLRPLKLQCPTQRISLPEDGNYKIGMEAPNSSTALSSRELFLANLLSDNEPSWPAYQDEDLIEAKSILESFLDNSMPHGRIYWHLSVLWNDEFIEQCRERMDMIDRIQHLHSVIDSYIQDESVDSLHALLQRIDSSSTLLIIINRFPVSAYPTFLRNLNAIRGLPDFLTRISQMPSHQLVDLIDTTPFFRCIASSIEATSLLLKQIEGSLHGKVLDSIGAESLIQLVRNESSFWILLKCIHSDFQMEFIDQLGDEIYQVIQCMQCVDALLIQMDDQRHQQIIDKLIVSPMRDKVLPNLTDTHNHYHRLHLWQSLRQFNIQLPNLAEHRFQLSSSLFAHFQSAKCVASRLQQTLLGIESDDWLWNIHDHFRDATLLAHTELSDIYFQVCQLIATSSQRSLMPGPYSSPGINLT
jgi:hypothetical protein